MKGIYDVIYDEKSERMWGRYENDRNTVHLGSLNVLNNRFQTDIREIKENPVTLLASFTPGKIRYSNGFIIHKGWREVNTFTTFSPQGEVLCRFSVGRDTITSRATEGINVDRGNNYMYNGMYTFRSSFNDTLFRVTSANTLKAEYVLYTGNAGRATNQGKISDVQIDQMYIIQSIREDNRYLYIRFSKNYDCPANRNNQTVHFYWGLYDKAKNEFFTLPFVSDSYPEGKGFQNDIDGGMSFWPFQVGERNEKISQTFINDELVVVVVK